MSFANWDEIIDTCMSYSTRTPHSSTSLALPEKRDIRTAQTADGTEWAQANRPDTEDSWMSKPYDEMLAHEYVSTTRT